MKKTLGSGLLLFILAFDVAYAQTNSDIVFVDRMGISNSANGFLLNSIMLGDRVKNVTSKDKIILYYANIGVINPTKKQYDVEIICVDTKGSVIINGAFKRTLADESNSYIGGDIIKSLEQTLGLDPKPGAMVKGQLKPLKKDNDYYVKLFFENKLVGVTKFSYGIEK